MENRGSEIGLDFEQELDEMIQGELGASFSERSDQIISDLERNRRDNLLQIYYSARDHMFSGKIGLKKFMKLADKFDSVPFSDTETILDLARQDLFPRELAKFEQKRAYEQVDEIDLVGIGEPGMDDFVVLPDGTIYCWSTQSVFKKINPDGSRIESNPGITPISHVKYIGGDKFMFMVGPTVLRIFDLTVPEVTTAVYEMHNRLGKSEIEDFAVLPNGELIVVRTEGMIESVDLTNLDKKRSKTKILYRGLTFLKNETFHRAAVKSNGEIIINLDLESIANFSRKKDRGVYKKDNIANELSVIMLENLNGKGLSYESLQNLCLRSKGTNSVIEMPGVVDMQPLVDSKALVAQAGMMNQALKIVDFNSRVISTVSKQVAIDFNNRKPRVCQATADGKIYLMEEGWKLLVFDGDEQDG